MITMVLVGMSEGMDTRTVMEYLADTPDLSILRGLLATTDLDTLLNNHGGTGVTVRWFRVREV